MPHDLIPERIRKFIYEHIDSIAELECLLLLRNDRSCEWNAEDLSKRLYIDTDEAVAVVDKLSALNLLCSRKEGVHVYWYCPQSQEDEVLIDDLADFYSRYLIPVTQLVHSKSKNRIQEFAEAFRIRKD